MYGSWRKTKMKSSERDTRAFCCFLLASLILLARPVAAEPDASREAQDLINRMSRAIRETSYEGVFVYARDGQMDSMRLIHRSANDGEYERMVSLTGMMREVIRDERSVTCIFPDNRAVLVEKSRPRKFVTALPEPIERIAAFYFFTLDGDERVAGRDAWVVTIHPRDDYRYGYQLWIDKESHLLLKSELRNKRGKALEQIMFTEIRIMDSVPDELLQPAVSGHDYTWYHHASAEPRAEGAPDGEWQVTWMPDGFTMGEHERQALLTSGDPVDHMVFSDGLASVSVFIEKLAEPQMATGPSRMGGISAFARTLGSYQVTAVGEVPPLTVQRMANSVAMGR
jgi:sigma-E factor negative regulatory protein RseB